MPRNRTREIILALRDFSRGILGGISERGVSHPNWVAGADNLYGRPYRAMRVRPGSRDISKDSLPNPPHSLMGYYSAGGNKLFVASVDKIHEGQTNSYIQQTLPVGHPAGSDIWSHANLDGVLITTQRGGALTPLMFDGAWKELKLPTPGILGFAASGANGAVDVGNHYYRIRWRFTKGSSVAGPPFGPILVAPGVQTVNINSGLAAPSRTDYLGWTLERTKAHPTAVEPWWFVADGTSTTYADVKADALLGYLVDEGLHGEPPHFDGLTGFAGLLWGWSGSKLYASRDIGGLEATGIANFDADDLFQISKDDGDTIQACIVVLNELLILKRHSVHIISGVDRESFVLESVVYADPARGSEAGCAGPRAVCVIGGKAYFWGESGGLFTYSRGSVSPVGWSEVGRYLDDVNPAQLDKLLLINHQGNYMLAWYPSGSGSSSNDQIVYDARFKQWWHWRGWGARDALEVKGGLFGNASLILADDKNRSTFPFIAAGSSIEDEFIVVGGGVLIPVTGAIPLGATVVANVPAGSVSLTMSSPALQNARGATFIIGGVRISNCNTTAGSVFIVSEGYRCLSAFDGFKDRKDTNGFFGEAVAVSVESPWMDGGLPDDWKDLDRVSFTADGDQVGVTIAIATDPPGGNTVISLSAAGQGLNWAQDLISDPSDLVWDVGDWATDAPTTSADGVRSGTLGRRFKFTVSANATGDYRPTGLEAVATLLPDKEYDR